MKNIEDYAVEGIRTNISELKKAMKNLKVENHKLRETMGERARKHVIENYKSKKIAQIFLERIKKYC